MSETIKARPPLSPVQLVEPMDCRREMLWLSQHRREYAGQWIALDGDHLIAHGWDAQEVFAEADRAGVASPFFSHIESAEQHPAIGS